MSEMEKLIITSISQPLETNPSFLSYKEILEELNKIDIWFFSFYYLTLEFTFTIWLYNSYNSTSLRHK